jgi:hypothetical protein
MAGPRQHSDSSADDQEQQYKDVEAVSLQHAAGAVAIVVLVHANCAMPKFQVPQAARVRPSHAHHAGEQRLHNGSVTAAGRRGETEALDGLSAGAEAAAVIMHDSETDHPDVLLR